MLVYTVKFYDATETQVIATQHTVALSPAEAVKQAEKDNPKLKERKAVAKAELFEIPGYILEARPLESSQLHFIMDYEQIAEIQNEVEKTDNALLKDKMFKMREKLERRVQKDKKNKSASSDDKAPVDSNVEPKYRVISRPNFDD